MSAESTRNARSRELRAAGIAIALIVIATVIVFTKSNPFTSTYEIRGVFSSAAQLHRGSEVRIGGQRIGKVTAIDHGPTAATSLVTMDIDDRHPEIRTDARLSIQPRLALEGNGYVRVEPGTPAASALPRGGTVPLTHTSVAVQFDQVLTMLDAPTRTAFNDLVKEFAGGLGSKPASPRTPRPGYVELRGAVREFDRSLATITTAAKATRGVHRGDLRRAARGTSSVAGQLASSPAALSGIVANYAKLSSTLARHDAALAATLRGLSQTFASAPGQLRTIAGALPSVTRFASVLTPALRAAPPALRRLTQTSRQIRLIAQPNELPDLITKLRPLTKSLPVLERRLKSVLPQVTSIGQCLTNTVVPALNEKIDDGALSTGYPLWQEALHMASSLAGAASGFDANGGTLRLGVTESEQAVGINIGTGPLGQLSGLSPDGDVGMNPTWLGYGIYPVARPDQPCSQQKLPDFNARKRPGRPTAFQNPRHVTPKTPTAGEIKKLLKQVQDPGTLLRQALKQLDRNGR